MNRDLQAVIFDVDGTLINSVDLHSQAWVETLEEAGKRVTFDEVRAQIGKGGDQLLPVFLNEAEMKAQGDALQQRRGEIFQKKYLAKITKFPGTRALFERLLMDGRKIALASSAKGEELEHYKKVAQITDLVDEQTSSDDAEKSKPYPDIFQAALERLGNPPSESVLVVGDTPYDIEAAGKAGLRTIAVRCGGFPEESLEGAMAIYDDPADLLKHYEDSPLRKVD